MPRFRALRAWTRFHNRAVFSGTADDWPIVPDGPLCLSQKDLHEFTLREMPMSIDWHFHEFRPGEKIREASQGAFFTSESLSGVAAALVREGIQNSLDAALPGKTVNVRIALGTLPDSSALEPYARSAWPHLRAPESGLEDPPSQSETCRYLVFEDFGTRGLDGDPTQAWPGVGENGFFHFFRAEGRSNKGNQDRGRWGLGKYVFVAASRAHMFFGLTIRQCDGRRMLMGQLTLRARRVDTTNYSPDGLYGTPQADGLILPIEDEQAIRSFQECFHLTRATEPGLSLVVPWHESGIDKNALLTAVLGGFFLPILRSQLEVRIDDGNGEEVRIDANTVGDLISDTGSGKDGAALNAIFHLACEACTTPSDQFLALAEPQTNGALKWTPAMFPDGLISGIRGGLDVGRSVALRVPLTIRPKVGEAHASFFDVFLVRSDDGAAERPMFVRNGIIVADIRPRRTPGVRSLVVIDDGPLATLLGDSENPAHTEWQKSCPGFKSKYFYAPSYVDFVTNSVDNIMHLVSASQREPDRDLLGSVFSLPLATRNAPRDCDAKPTPKPGRDPNIPEPQVQHASPKRFRVSHIPTGFWVGRGEPGAPRPAELRVQVAYDVIRGNPLAKYETADFDVSQDPIVVSAERGLALVRLEKNKIVVKVVADDFRLVVTGFDPNRDLLVKVTAAGEVDDD